MILLITLFFISALSVLILKNLDDSEQFIKATALDNTLIQLKITSRNIEDQVRKLIKKYNNNIDDVVKITQNGIPMNLKGIDMLIKLEYYNDIDCNINDINKSTSFSEIIPLLPVSEERRSDKLSVRRKDKLSVKTIGLRQAQPTGREKVA